MSRDIPTIPTPERTSRAFFAALLAAVEGKDEEAAEILRTIARDMREEFLSTPVTKRGRRKTRS